MHLGILDDLRREYPDLAVVFTHRDPAEAIGSSASVHARTYGVVTDELDLRRIGKQQQQLAEHLLGRAETSREGLVAGGVPIADVRLADLKADPIAAVETVYRQIGLDFTTEARRAMETWLVTRQVRHGGHRFALGDFGLDAEALVQSSGVLGRYCERHSLDGPGCGKGGLASTR